MRGNLRRCCEPGCAAVQAGGSYAGNGWYRVGIGFMQHACPEHADKWRAADQRERAWEARLSEMHTRGEQWLEALLEQICPAPPDLEMQSSIEFDPEPDHGA